jgi:hypothetical protein
LYLQRFKEIFLKIQVGTPTHLIKRDNKDVLKLLNFKQWFELTREIANASLLDESTAAAEAMATI